MEVIGLDLFTTILRKVIEKRVELKTVCPEPSKIQELKDRFDALIEAENGTESAWNRQDRVMDGKPGASTS